MPKIRETLLHLRSQQRTAFIPFIMAGDPDLETTLLLLQTLIRSGVDLIEVGVPFSDPIADGPVNQAAAERALAAGTSLSGILEMLTRLRAETPNIPPLILFSYANPILRLGLETFAQRAQAAGLAGLLVVDLPPEEAGEMVAALSASELEWVALASPTTPPERLPLLSQLASGCVYYVARAGVTGTQSELSASLAAELAAVRAQITAPLVVGFGISTPEHVATLAPLADGIVVGSALVKVIAEAPNPATAQIALQDCVASLQAPLRKDL